MPPESVAIAAARRMSGTQSGAVMRVTSTDPSVNLPASARDARRLTGPLACPGAAPSPRRSTVPAGSCGVLTGAPTAVTGLDCSIHVLPAVSIAHSVSCGAP